VQINTAISLFLIIDRYFHFFVNKIVYKQIIFLNYKKKDHKPPAPSQSSGQVPDALLKALNSSPMGKKPFTYTPGGIDLSQVRNSARVKRYDSMSNSSDLHHRQHQQQQQHSSYSQNQEMYQRHQASSHSDLHSFTNNQSPAFYGSPAGGQTNFVANTSNRLNTSVPPPPHPPPAGPMHSSFNNPYTSSLESQSFISRPSPQRHVPVQPQHQPAVVSNVRRTPSTSSNPAFGITPDQLVRRPSRSKDENKDM
jgi:hypothetical protein